MGRSVNKVILIGTLGRDPELRYMPNGNPVASIALATDESYTDKTTGQKVEQTEWHRITAYGKLGEVCAQYLKKGSKAYFEGKLRTREWEKDGVKRYTTEIIASDLTMMSQGGAGQQQSGPTQSHSSVPHGQPQSQNGQPAPAAPAPAMNGFDDFDDDIPF